MTLERVTPSYLGLPDQEAIRNLLGVKIWQAVGPHAEHSLIEPAREMAARPSKHFRAQLVHLGYQLVRSTELPEDKTRLEQAAAAIELLHTGSLIVDDIQDQSLMRRGGASLHRLLGIPGALCAGNWLYFRPLRLIEELGLCPEIENQAFRLYHEALELAHYGQALDLGIKVDQLNADDIPEICDAVSALKTGSITALAMSLGSLVGGADFALARRIGDFGRQFGTALQQCDDIGSLTSPQADPAKKFEDLLQRKPSAAWSFAKRLTPKAFAGFQAAVEKISEEPQWIEAWLKEHHFADRAFSYVQDQLSKDFEALRLVSGIHSEALSKLQKTGEQLIHAYR